MFLTNINPFLMIFEKKISSFLHCIVDVEKIFKICHTPLLGRKTPVAALPEKNCDALYLLQQYLDQLCKLATR